MSHTMRNLAKYISEVHCTTMEKIPGAYLYMFIKKIYGDKKTNLDNETGITRCMKLFIENNKKIICHSFRQAPRTLLLVLDHQIIIIFLQYCDMQGFNDDDNYLINFHRKYPNSFRYHYNKRLFSYVGKNYKELEIDDICNKVVHAIFKITTIVYEKI